ncbi:NUDIX hydrolase [Streptomyces sp. NBC_00715]|uniref:NUDIX hydrolase n=1 Tax=Streptomyces sp. NBC_00715 TaxID=2975811 RepID=UPI0038644EEF
MAVIVDVDGRLLLIQRRVAERDLAWALPGGKIENGESPGEAAAREALEETGLRVRASRQLGERVHPDTGRLIKYVACRVLAGEATAASPREVSAVAWVLPGELGQYIPRGLYTPVLAYVAGAGGPDL